MTRDEAKDILLLYRHSTSDADDPQIASALALAKSDPELKHWLVRHCAQQFVLQQKFRQITAPAGLKEQIISEQVAQAKSVFWRRHGNLLATAAVAVMVVLLSVWLQPRESKRYRHISDLPQPDGRGRAARLRDGLYDERCGTNSCLAG